MTKNGFYSQFWVFTFDLLLCPAELAPNKQAPQIIAGNIWIAHG